MHRSGTSAVTGLLHRLGCWFGPDDVSTGANEENPKGFFERRDVRRLNDALLASAAADWDRVAGFSCDRIPPDARREFRRRARSLVSELDGHRPWVVKEPRLALLLPEWLGVVEHPLIVLVHRNPLEVADSLAHRNDFPRDFALALWEAYNVMALGVTRELPRLIVAYDELVADPAAAAGRWATALQRLGVTGLDADPTTAAAFVDPRLHRCRRRADELDEALTPAQLALHRRLCNADRHDDPPTLSAAAGRVLSNHERRTPAATTTASRSTTPRTDATAEVAPSPTDAAAGAEHHATAALGGPRLSQLLARTATPYRTQALSARRWAAHRFAHVVAAFEDMTSRAAITSVLSVGCGRGLPELQLAAMFPGIDFVLSDIDLTRVRLAGQLARRENLSNVIFETLDVLDPAQGRFDAVINVELLTHLEHDRQAARGLLQRARRFVYTFVPFCSDADLADEALTRRARDHHGSYRIGYSRRSLAALFARDGDAPAGETVWLRNALHADAADVRAEIDLLSAEELAAGEPELMARVFADVRDEPAETRRQALALELLLAVDFPEPGGVDG